MSRTKIVLVAGAIGSGKTAFTAHAEKMHGGRVLAFADHLKAIVRREFGILASNNLETQLEKMMPLTDKPFMIRSEIDICNLNLVHSALSGVLLSEVPKEKTMQSVNILSTAETNAFFWNSSTVITQHPGLVFRLSADGIVFVVDPKTNTAFQMFWTPRAILVTVATHFRSIDQHKWVRKVAQDIEEAILANKEKTELLFVISDFRQPDEHEFIKKWFAKYPNITIETVQLLRNFKLTGRPEETALINYAFDNKINNQLSDLEVFKSQVDDVLKKLHVGQQ